MSIYAMITTPKDLSGSRSGNRLTVEDETIWEGVEAGLFRFVSPLQTQRGAVVEMLTTNENEARWLLESLVFVNAGLVQAELIETPNTEKLGPLASVTAFPTPLQSRISQLVL